MSAPFNVLRYGALGGMGFENLAWEIKEFKFKRGLSALFPVLATALILSACSGSKTPRPEALIPQELPSNTNLASGPVTPASSMPAYNSGSLAFSDIALGPTSNEQLLGPRVNQLGHVSSKTKFSSAAYGVAGSERVSSDVLVRKGGGTYKLGRPYTIRGVRYVPKLNMHYVARGMASWYGPNFHGRLTANGEVYDQFALSAAHPTMPLPSYAKVTNLENGASVIVRVNDRGPYSKGRIIDLSSRAAQLLGYTKNGVAKVKVKYVGKARMDGLDEEYLVSSYNPGRLDPSTIPPNGRDVLLAGNTHYSDALAQPKMKPGAKKRYTGDSLFTALFGWMKPASKKIAAVPISRRKPLSDLTGFAQHEPASNALQQIENSLSPDIAMPSQGMDALETFLVGPFASRKQASVSEEVLSKFGPVTAYRGNADWVLHVRVAGEDRERFLSIIDRLN